MSRILHSPSMQNVTLPLLLAALVVSSVVAQTPSQSASGPARGSVPSGVRVSTYTIPLMKWGESFGVRPAEPEKVHRQQLEPPAGLPPPSHPEGFNYQADPSVKARGTASPPYILRSFQAISQTPSIPPDPVIAAGPRHLVAAVNREFRFFDKTGAVLDSIDAATWYSTTLPGAAPFDPRVRYDHFANRFLMLWHHQDERARESYYLLSISDDDDPLGVWTSWALPADLNGTELTDTWADNGCLGFDQDAVYITSDQWDFAKGTFVYAKLRIIPKAQLLSGQTGTLVWTDFWNIRNGQAFRVRPAVMHSAAVEYYLMEVPDFTLGTSVVLYTVSNSLSVPTLRSTLIPVTGWARARDAEQLGGGTPIDARRSTLAGEVQYLNGSVCAVWPVANPVSPNHTCIRYVRISTDDSTAVEDITFGARGFWYLYPAVAVDKDGNSAISFTRTGESEFAGAYMTWRLATDGPSLRSSVVMQPGWAHYQKLDPDGENRWGDYNAAVIDPADRNVFWLMGEYAEAPANTWGTWAIATRLAAAPVAEAVLSRHVMDFGVVDVPGPGEPLDTVGLTLWNTGTVPLVVSGVAHARAGFEVAGPSVLPATVLLGDSIRLAIICNPAAPRPLIDTLLISCNDPAAPVLRVVLRATVRPITPADPLVMYGLHTGQSVTSLYRLDTLGTAAPIGAMAFSGVRSLSANPADRHIYGIAEHGHGTSLFRVDAATGESFAHRLFGVSDLSAMAFGPEGGLYGGSRSGGFYRLVTATSEAILMSRGPSYSGLSFAPDSTLWASAGEPYGNDTIYTVNPRTGEVNVVGPTGFSVRTSSLTHDRQGKMLALAENSLLRIDPATGAGTFLTYYGIEGLRAIAMLPRSFVAAGDGVVPPVPVTFALHQNFPNPFNPKTTVAYEVPERTFVSLKVFTILGQQVVTLVEGVEEPGHRSVSIDATGYSSGVYLCRMQAGSFVGQRRMVLIR